MSRSPLREHLPHLSPALAEAGNDWYSRAPAQAGNGGALVWQQAQPALVPALQLTLSGLQGHRACVWLQCPVRLQEFLAGSRAQYPEADWLRLVQSVLGDVLDALELSLGMPLEVLAGRLGADDADPADWAFAFEFRQKPLQAAGPLWGEGVRGCLRARSGFWQSAALCQPPVRAAAVQPPRGWLAAAGLACSLVIGETTLPAAALRPAEVGGWVRMMRHGFAASGGGHFVLRGKAVGVHCHVQVDLEGRVYMTEIPYPAELPAGLQAQVQTDAAEVPGTQHDIALQEESPLDRVPVTVRFEVGTLRMPLNKLYAVRPGYVFDLGCPLEQHMVRLMVDDFEVGQGTLVAIGDAIGVRLHTVAGGGMAAGPSQGDGA